MPTNWADEVDGVEAPQMFTDAHGITTHIEFRINEDGKKVKVMNGWREEKAVGRK